ncbi:calcium and integrin-binding protein 1-like [Mizuhopecten yessoensis]|uniref:Calcium and integrin-binding protein 1 n=1 Tax=Mizuhopecten yessoensis TaxID=6573 RepID=A0A210Q6W0_MIZYE|nr:calcium and integrin-binding protein 1-like [Mizuhopecten yessoensis]OWF44461.1 Calcium and integrin-binding protein 1 [Mizuhopecten yessoensis]
MGASQSVFSEEELQDYQELTYFTKKEILHVFKIFRDLSPRDVDRDRNVKLNEDLVMSLPELKMNPFKDRIVRVFSSEEGCLTFEDFLDMMSVFSEKAPKEIKAQYAFKIYDFDGDDEISRDDLKKMVLRLCPSQKDTELKKQEVDRLVGEILKEADLDNDDRLSFSEFQHVISKAPEFESSFRIRL